MKQPLTKALHEQLSDAQAFAEVVIKLRARIAELERLGDAIAAAGNELYCLEHEDIEGCSQEESEDEPSTVICTCGMVAAEEQWRPAASAWRKFRAGEGIGK